MSKFKQNDLSMAVKRAMVQNLIKQQREERDRTIAESLVSKHEPIVVIENNANTETRPSWFRNALDRIRGRHHGP